LTSSDKFGEQVNSRINGMLFQPLRSAVDADQFACFNPEPETLNVLT